MASGWAAAAGSIYYWSGSAGGGGGRSRAVAVLAVLVETTAASGLHVGERFSLGDVERYPEIGALLQRAMEIRHPFTAGLREGALAGCRAFFEWLMPPVQLVVCGAGMDAQ